jgi:membrane-associated phospholipid phosphatase
MGDHDHGWAPEIGLLLGAAGVSLLLVDGTLLDLDWAVRDWVAAHQAPVPHLLARGLNFAGSANVLAAIALLLAAPTVLRARTRQATVLAARPIVLALLLSYALIGPIKLWTDRAAPNYPSWNAAELFTHPDGWSFPSGHVVNAIIWYRVLLMLFEAALRRPLSPRRRRLFRAVPPLLVCATVTYLNYHWLTDSIVAVLLGLFLERILGRLDRVLDRHRPARRPWGDPRHVERCQPTVPV